MPFESFEPGILSWVITYALHSSALLGAAWWLTRRRRRGTERFQELVWKTALVGGLVTTSLQTALDLRPLAGRFEVEPARGPRVVAEGSGAPIVARAATEAAALPIEHELGTSARLEGASERAPGLADRAAPARTPEPRERAVAPRHVEREGPRPETEATQLATLSAPRDASTGPTTPVHAAPELSESSVPPWAGWSDALLALWLAGARSACSCWRWP